MAVTIQEPRGYPVAPLGGDPPATPAQAASQTWVRRIVDVVNSVRQGKMNALLDFTLRTAPNTTTVLIDERISIFSALLLMPLTADAAAIQSSVWPSVQNNGTATFTHLATAETDCKFRMCIIG